MKIWHDNSGKEEKASWFLKYIIVHDVQTREKFYFMCQKWLAIEKDDGKIQRELFIACEKQKSHIGYLLKNQVQYALSDSHLWYSVFARPVHSSFTRLDRVTCCFVILYLTMLMNIIYYGASNEVHRNNTYLLDSQAVLFNVFGIFKVSLEQVIHVFKVFLYSGYSVFVPCHRPVPVLSNAFFRVIRIQERLRTFKDA